MSGIESEICPDWLKDKFNTIPKNEGSHRDHYLFGQQVARLKDESLANSDNKLAVLKSRFKRQRVRIGTIRKFSQIHGVNI